MIKTSTNMWCDLCDSDSYGQECFSTRWTATSLRAHAKNNGWKMLRRRSEDGTMKIVDVCPDCAFALGLIE